MRQSDRQGKWHACCGYEASQQLNIDSRSDYVRGGQAWFAPSEDEEIIGYSSSAHPGDEQLSEQA